MAILGDIYSRNAAQAPLDERPLLSRSAVKAASEVSYAKAWDRAIHSPGVRKQARRAYARAARAAARRYCRRMVG